MLRCLSLASLGRRRVGNGALVGAVLVREGKIIAEGFHAGYGMPHAERMLLENFDQEIQQKDVLYVNLEPCCHHGKTPPCTDSILERGIHHVVFGLEDPDARVRGEGIALLREKGLEVIGPVSRANCERYNRGFMSLRTKSRPWITIKMAKDRAGNISRADGSTLKITSKYQDIFSHTYLRARADGILIGVGTVIADNPKLDTRFDQNKKLIEFSALIKNKIIMNKKIEPYRIIVDPSLRIPTAARVLTDEYADRTIVLTRPSKELDQNTLKQITSKGARIWHLSISGGLFDWSEMRKVLTEPSGDFHGLSSLLVEGGAKTWSLFERAGCVDEKVTLTQQETDTIIEAA